MTQGKTRNIRVLPAGGRGKWKVTVDGQTTSSHRLKRRAVEEGVRQGHGPGPAELRIHGLDGRIQEERTYNKPDPFPPEG
jgi:hypothetical protein